MKRATYLALARWGVFYHALTRTGLVWAIGWAILSVIPAIATWLIDPSLDTLGHLVTFYVVVFCAWGGISGIGFGILLMTAAHQDRVADFSIPRVAIWSAFAGFMIPFVGILAVNTAFGWGGMPRVVPIIAGFAGAVLSAGSAAVTLTISKRALGGPTHEPHNLPAT